MKARESRFKEQIADILNVDDLNKTVAIVRARSISYRRFAWYIKVRGSWYRRGGDMWIETCCPVEGTCEIFDTRGRLLHSGWTDEWQHWLKMA